MKDKRIDAGDATSADGTPFDPTLPGKRPRVGHLHPLTQTINELKDIMGRLGFTYDEASIDYLIETHYKKTGRPFRCCQPRDLLQQVKNYCLFRKIEPKLTEDFLDLACENYFAVM